MTPLQEGAYIRLLCHAWNSDDCGLPDDDEKLAKLARISRENHSYWSPNKSRIMANFVLRNGRWYNDKLLSLRTKQTVKSFKAAESAARRWDANALRSECEGNATRARAREETPPAASAAPRNDISPSLAFSPSEDLLSDGSTVHRSMKTKFSAQNGWFDEFWVIYPRHIAKSSAKKAFFKKITSLNRFEQMMAALKAQKVAMMLKEPQFCPHPATWLNQERWDDEDEELPGIRLSAGEMAVMRAQEDYDAERKNGSKGDEQARDVEILSFGSRRQGRIG